MRIFLDRKRLEASLPHVARGVVALVVAPHVGRQQPLEVAREVAFSPRPQDQVKVIRHETEPQHAHLHTFTGLLEQRQKRPVVRGIVKHLRPAVAPVQDVVAQTTNGRSRGARHAGSLASARVPGKEKSRMSPFFPFICCNETSSSAALPLAA